MIVRPVEVQEEIPNLTKESESAGGPVCELLSRSIRRQGPADDQAPLLTRLNAPLVENQMERRGPFEKKNALDRARFAAGANHGFVSAFPDEKLDRPDNHRLPRTRFPGDRDKSPLGFPEQILDESKISDSQRGQRCGHSPTMPLSVPKAKRWASWNSHFWEQAHRMEFR
jgi:hypothetical protein